MKGSKILAIVACLFMLSGAIYAQNSRVTVVGQAYGINNATDLITLFVVSQENRRGNFGNPNGTFQITVDREDTILIGSIGYFTEKICMVDSADKDTLFVDVILLPLQYYLQEVTVFAPRELERIYEGIEKLGYDPNDDKLSGFVDPLSSPITALYETYNKHAKKERLAKQLINDAKRRDLLKELFVTYVAYDIIDLSNDQFDAFIEYLNIDDHFLQSSTQYDFIIFVKKKYAYFKKQHQFDEGWDPY